MLFQEFSSFYVCIQWVARVAGCYEHELSMLQCTLAGIPPPPFTLFDLPILKIADKHIIVFLKNEFLVVMARSPWEREC